MSEDRDTNPDPRSPYEHVLGELSDIKSICQATHDRVAGTQALAVFATFASVMALLLAACSYAR